MDKQETTREMLGIIREIKDIMLEEKEANKSKNNGIPITNNDKRFGDVRRSQEKLIKQTIDNNVTFSEKALVFYPKTSDLALNGSIPSMSTKFQFRFNDPSGEGCYIWSDALQLTDSNARSIGKLRDAFINWRHELIEQSDIIEKMKKELKDDQN